MLEAAAGVPVNVSNRVGGAGVTGHSAGAQANPDGYTILTITVEVAMMHWRGLTDVSYKDYAPLCLFNRDPSALFVRADSDWQTLEDLRRHLEAQPESLRASGTALGGIWHLGCAGALVAMNLKPDAVVWVPSTGSAPALQELISGGIEIVCCSLPEARTLREGGKVRALGVMAEQRLTLFPDVPTLRDLGYDWSIGGWRGLALPRGTPPEVVARVGKVVGSVAGGQEFQTFLRNSGFGVNFEDAQVFAETLKREDRALGALLDAAIGKSTNEHAPGPWFFPILLSVGLAFFGLAIGIGQLRATPKR
jgi:tripartite-type tricarboxylate transporter receptor subunit TctC